MTTTATAAPAKKRTSTTFTSQEISHVWARLTLV